MLFADAARMSIQSVQPAVSTSAPAADIRQDTPLYAGCPATPFARPAAFEGQPRQLSADKLHGSRSGSQGVRAGLQPAAARGPPARPGVPKAAPSGADKTPMAHSPRHKAERACGYSQAGKSGCALAVPMFPARSPPDRPWRTFAIRPGRAVLPARLSCAQNRPHPPSEAFVRLPSGSPVRQAGRSLV